MAHTCLVSMCLMEQNVIVQMATAKITGDVQAVQTDGRHW
jgi:hypothetical protein